MTTIDLNADVGEGAGADAELIPLVTSANICCGAHAGDDSTIDEAVRIAIEHSVAIGAHPGHADRKNFGRVEIPLSADDAYRLVSGQIDSLRAVVEAHGGVLRYVKPHGALYHQAGRDAAIADAIARAAGGVALLGQAGTELETAAKQHGLRFYREAFPDRRYLEDGSLAPRTQPGAVLTNADKIATQAVRLSACCESLCLHGDEEQATANAKAVRRALSEAGVTIVSFTV